MSAVLGIDLASASWKANGTALVAWSDEQGDVHGRHGVDASRTFVRGSGRRDVRHAIARVESACIEWPRRDPLTPESLAGAVDAYARRQGVRVVAIDGPHAWRDPARGADGPGVGRWCEYLVRAQGKTGVRGASYPRTQLAWTSFSIAVFDALLARSGVRLAEPAVTPPDGYLVLETYPTATWRAAGLAPLPAKARRPDVAAGYARLAQAFDLPRDVDVRGHDDLQAVLAALVAVGVAGGPVGAGWHGHPCRVVDGVRVEGGIWVATPL